MWPCSVLFLLFMFAECYCVIYYLNDTDYERMPPKFALDDYDSCIQQAGGRYCTVDFELLSDKPSDLLYMIQEYSKVTTTHFNHTKLTYGICVTGNEGRCQQYTRNTTAVSERTFEGCLNDSLWESYELKTRVTHHNCFSLSERSTDIYIGDWIVAFVLGLIVMLNVIGTLYGFYKTDKYEDSSILLCFSITRNWKRLTNQERSEPRLNRLKGLNAIKAMIVVGVAVAHSVWPIMVVAGNQRGLELAYYNLSQYILINGPLVIQAYLVISGFLLTYKFQIYGEKNEVNWYTVPKGILLRYIRLTPSWAVLIALWATWLRFIGPGPFWEDSGALSVRDCHNRWWASLLYINNYVPEWSCMMHTWYLAVDMQLYIFGLIICVILKKRGKRRVVLTSLFVIGLIIPALHIYFQDLDAILLINLEDTRRLFIDNPTFNEVYRRGHTNIASYVIGVALGYLIYEWQDRDVEKYRKYRIFYWSTLPIGTALLLSGRMFFRDAPRDSVYVRMLYGALAKPFLGFLFAVIMCGSILKYENFYRGVLEWRVWTVPGRLSYCAFLIHFCLLTIYTSVQTKLQTVGPYDLYILYLWITIAMFILALPLWLLVECPFNEITKYKAEPKAKRKVEEKVNEAFSINL